MVGLRPKALPARSPWGWEGGRDGCPEDGAVLIGAEKYIGGESPCFFSHAECSVCRSNEGEIKSGVKLFC